MTLEVGFTPVIDSLVLAHGKSVALTFGVVWRFCQMRDGVCSASIPKIARRAGLDERTVRDCLSILIAHRYIAKEVRPGQTSIYHDEGKAGLVPMVFDYGAEDRN